MNEKDAELLRQMDDLLAQATTEKSHFYVASVLEKAKERLIEHLQFRHQHRHCDRLGVSHQALMTALEPFIHPDLCEDLGNTRQGAASPIYGRNDATLTLGDFQRAKAAHAMGKLV